MILDSDNNFIIQLLDLPSFTVNFNDFFRPIHKIQTIFYPNIDFKCILACRILVIQYNNVTTIIDTGFYAENKSIINEFGIQQFRSVEKILNNIGISRNDVTHVLHTHLHIDHCGGSFSKDPHGKIIPTFPFAQYWVSQKQLYEALRLAESNPESFDREIIKAFSLNANIRLVNSDAFIFPWLEIIETQGHTAGLLIPILRTNTKTIVFAGDLIPTRTHYEQKLASYYDNNPLQVIAERDELFEQLKDEFITIIFQHDFYCSHVELNC